MAVEFLIGGAGSGKTYTCLEQVVRALAVPEGPRLLWIAPKQFTFQLEREVLACGVRGFTRLEILPFDRVARRVLGDLNLPVRDVLSEDGRVMVLHAILLEAAPTLEVFGPSARAPGFASQLSQVLRELSQGGISLERLRKLGQSSHPTEGLSGKLRDLARLRERYQDWLGQHGLRDPDDLLGRAAEAVSRARAMGRPTPRFSGLWLDGFAEMTVPELELLAALLPECDQATLAFCLDQIPAPDRISALWSVTAGTYLRCVERIQAMGLSATVRMLPEEGGSPPRFRDAAVLASLANGWAGRRNVAGDDRGVGGAGMVVAGQATEGRRGPEADQNTARPQPGPTTTPQCGNGGGVTLVECADPEAEALLAVRLINRHVRQDGGRYREISVIVRRFEGYGDVVQRAFRRHGIPYFADHREPMGHHPVVELTRSALRMAAHGWAHEDWMGALKSGLVVADPGFVDQLENAALAHGLRGEEWMRLAEYRVKADLSDRDVRDLERPVAAWVRFRSAVGAESSGTGLAGALRRLWSDVRVPEILERWQAEAGTLPPVYRAIHHTAWEQTVAWCDALDLAFGNTVLPVSEWCGIAEAGLCRLTLGIIPPALDQVLLGAIDRMRQPEVKLAIVLGLNEGVFPAAPASPALLNLVERQALAAEGLPLGWTPLEMAAREQYYAYIACTRPSRKLCLAWSRRGLDGATQVRSSAAERVIALLGFASDAKVEEGDATVFDGRLKAFQGAGQPGEAVTLPELFECGHWDAALPPSLVGDTALGSFAAAAQRLRAALQPEGGEAARRLLPGTVATLYPGGVLVSSVSALEDYAECPFRHFAGRALRLEERDEFKADASETGNLLHAILKAFHDRTLQDMRAWRAWSPAEAAARVATLGREQLQDPRFGPLIQDPLVAWETHRRIRGLAAMIEQGIAWLQTNAFDPVYAELRFGEGSGCELPPWILPLGEGRELRLRGSIDRLDVCRHADGRVLVAVLDYKSTAKPPSAAKLEHGFELQLLAYLAYAAESPRLRELVSPGVEPPPHLEPAGAFYVPLAPTVESDDRAATPEQVRNAYLDSLTFEGRGDKQWLAQFDGSSAAARGRSRQFKSRQLLEGAAFRALIGTTVNALKRHAAAILDGRVGVEPVRFGAANSACDHCPFHPLCRVEPLRHGFRGLPPVATKPGGPSGPREETPPSDLRGGASSILRKNG